MVEYNSGQEKEAIRDIFKTRPSQAKKDKDGYFGSEF
jgi:hypothetical protein